MAASSVIPSVRRGFLVCLCLVPLALPGKIRFSGLDLDEDRLLFEASSSGGGAETQNALFLANLAERTAVPLTVFPETMELLEGGGLVIHNAFGTQLLSLEGGLPRPFPGFPSFTARSSPGGRAEQTAVSPDGRWLLYVEPESHGRGTLVMLDGKTGQRTAVSPELERPGRNFPARWSADSRGFLYAKGGRLYFYTAGARSAPPEERRRLIGEGGIASVYWAEGSGFAGHFYYLRGSTVYRIRGEELFARTLYSGFLELGRAAGKIPFAFDPAFDRYWVSPDGRSLLLCKDGRSLFYYPLGVEEYTETDYASLPYVVAPRSGAGISVLWSAGGTATALIASPGSVLAYRINSSGAAPDSDRT